MLLLPVLSKRQFIRLLAAFNLVCASSCQKYDFVEEKASEKSNDVVATEKTDPPRSSGHGTMASPYTVSQLLSSETLDSDSLVWCIGYVVGSTYRSMAAANFSVPTEYRSNILMAQDSTATEADDCIPVELNKPAIQKALNLVDNPSRLHKCVMVEGRVGSYFSQIGLRNTASYLLLPGFNLSALSTTPESLPDIEYNF